MKMKDSISKLYDENTYLKNENVRKNLIKVFSKIKAWHLYLILILLTLYFKLYK